MALFVLNDCVEYFSESYKQWIACTITHLGPDGAVQASCKPGYWMPLDEQARKLRHAQPSSAPSAPASRRPSVAGVGSPCDQVTMQATATLPPASHGYDAGTAPATFAAFGASRAFMVPKDPDRKMTATPSQEAGSAPTSAQMKSIRKILDSKEEIKKNSLLHFRRFDKDGDGLLEPDEFQVCMETLRKELGIPSVHSSQIQMLIHKFDIDGNGALDRKEFQEFFQRVLIKSRQCFEEFKVHSDFFVEKQQGSPYDFYKVIKQLGEGTYGLAHLVEDTRSAQTRVLKTINKKKTNMPPEELEQEIKSLRTLDHPHIIKLFEYYEDDLNIYLAMEAAQGGELLKVIEDLFEQGWRVSERWSSTVMQQVIEAMTYCHGRRIIHKDIKAENIMLLRSTDSRTHPHAVVIDLGLAEMFSTTNAVVPGRSDQRRPSTVSDAEDLYKRVKSQKVGGTPTTMAPEVWRSFMGKGSFGMKCDVYSLGVVLFQLLTGELPFIHRTIEPMEWLEKIKRGPPLDLLVGCSEESQELVCKMLAFDERERPTARQALGHPWFAEKTVQVHAALSEKQMSALRNFEKKNELQKAVTLQVASQLRAAEVPRINAIFRKYDADNTGCLESEELQKALQEMGCDEETAIRAAKAIDLDKSGDIEYTEFVAACISLFDDRHEAYLWQIFSKMDKERRGILNYKDVEDLLTEGHRHGLGFTPSRAEITKIIEDMDMNKDGQIRFEEFVHYLNPHAHAPS